MVFFFKKLTAWMRIEFDRRHVEAVRSVLSAVHRQEGKGAGLNSEFEQ